MTKKSRIEIARDIVSRVKKEMDEPRLAQSVRHGFRVAAERAVGKPVARVARG